MITFDDSLWPLLTVTLTGTNSAQDFDTFQSKMTAYLNRGEKYLCIIDTSDLLSAPSMERRQRHVDWIRRNELALRQRMLGCAFVITSPFVRLALNIVFQLKPLPCLYTNVGDVKVARAWAVERFRAAGLPIPSPLIRNP